ncbi:accessory gene regulator B family protein [Paenibacillus tarimensis]|nr:accessory gene regulator B family protein [Paenibacillus tarimensis]
MRIAESIKKAAPDHPASVEVLRYSVSFLINTFLIISFTLSIACITGRLTEACISLFSFALLRQVSGGYHLGSGMWCILLSTLLLTGLTFVEFQPQIIDTMNVVSAVLVLIYAPSRIERQTRISAKHFPVLKLVSFWIVALSFLAGDSVLTATLFVQSLSLIRRL